MQVFLNGAFVAVDEARVSVFDRGFLLGHGAFETMRAYRGRVFRPAQHLERLHRTCAALGIPFVPDIARLEPVVETLLARNGLADARLRLTVTAGPEEEYLPCHPTILLAAFPLPTGTAAPGWRAYLWQGAVNSHDPLRTHKTTSYLEKVLARREAKSKGFDEALFVNEKENVTEGSATNIFCIRAGTILTPPTVEGLLPGVTRAVVAELATRTGIPFLERPLAPEDIVRSDEAFLTNSVVEIVPLVAVGRTPVGNGAPGPLTARLQAAYRELVRQELGVG
ncbi:MAG: aminotransferase class IV [Thermoanaerobacterales bacterium]|nr:aminotransferase class IV [Thermoanaerobacterales bacterium]